MIAEDPLEPEDPRKVGESLWPWRFGTATDLEATKISAGSYTSSSLYQQRPAPAGGLIFNRGWWGDSLATTGRNQFYKQNPQDIEKLMDIVIQSWDATFKDNANTDFVVGQVWGKKGADFYLLDQVRARMDIIATMQAIQTLSGKWKLSSAKLIEDKANGPGIITMLKHQIPGIIPVEPQGGKVVRAQAITPYIEAGNVWIPMPINAPWIHDALEEIAALPTGRYDDVVDSLTQALFYLSNTHRSALLPKMPRHAIRVGGGWTG
jgi:predicted phage terminase large subunit-like protein